MEKKYPLEIVQRVRAERVEVKAKELAAAVRKVTDSKTRADDRRRAKEAYETRCVEDLRAERKRLDRGELVAVDLQRTAGWILGMDLGRAAHARDLARAEADLAQARGRAEDERQLLVKEQASSDVVERHRTRWEAERRSAGLAAEQEQAEEIHAARLHGSTTRPEGQSNVPARGLRGVTSWFLGADREGKPK